MATPPDLISTNSSATAFDRVLFAEGDVGVLLTGGPDDDFLSGNNGDDTLDGGDGSDTYFGGDGGDAFILDPFYDGADTIADFTAEDRIEFTFSPPAGHFFPAAIQEPTLTVLEVENGTTLLEVRPWAPYLYGSLQVSLVGEFAVEDFEFQGQALVLRDSDPEPPSDRPRFIGTSGDDTLFGPVFSFFDGADGNDTFILNDGRGRVAIGGAGEDTFRVEGLLTPGLAFATDAERDLYFAAGAFPARILDFEPGDRIEVRGLEIESSEPFVVTPGPDGTTLLQIGTVLGERTIQLAGEFIQEDFALESTVPGQSFADVFQDFPVVFNVAEAEIELSVVPDVISIGAIAHITLVTGDNPGDTLFGGAADNSLRGGFGDDRLSGSDGNDSLNGGAGDDRLLGGAGDDFLYISSGEDILFGGSGNDTFVLDLSFVGNDSQIVDFGVGDAIVVTETFLPPAPPQESNIVPDLAFTEIVDLGVEYDSEANLTRLQFVDAVGEIRGTVALQGFFDAGELLFESGTALDDITVRLLATEDLGSPADENDNIMLPSFPERADATEVTGTVEGDLLFGTSLADTFRSGAGNDLLFGKARSVFASQMDGFTPEELAVILFGPPLPGTALPSPVADTADLIPGEGIDTLLDWGVDDRLTFGGFFPEEITSIESANGFTTVTFQVTDASPFISGPPPAEPQIEFATVRLAGDLTEDDFLFNAADVGPLGIGFDSVVLGDRSRSFLQGTNNDDTLEGTSASEILIGAEGDDTLDGSHGSDTYFGGDGADVFALDPFYSGVDTIVDFRSEDRIEFTFSASPDSYFPYAIQAPQVEVVRVEDGLTLLEITPLAPQLYGPVRVNLVGEFAAEDFEFLTEAERGTLVLRDETAFSLDINGDGEVRVIDDGMEVLRVMLGIPMADDTNRDAIQDAIDGGIFDFDQNGSVELLTDAFNIVRVMLELPTEMLALGANTPEGIGQAEVEAAIEALF